MEEHTVPDQDYSNNIVTEIHSIKRILLTVRSPWWRCAVCSKHDTGKDMVLVSQSWC